MDLGIDGSVFIVSGGTRGLGRAAAESLVEEGAKVVVSGRHAATVLETSAALRTDRAIGVVADSADPQGAERLVATAMARYGRLDGALINVGGPPAGRTSEITDEIWRLAFESVFLGPVRLARAVARELPAYGGSIAFVLSTSVREPIAGLVTSNGLRPGLAGVAKTLADELGPRNIRVNGLLPGRIATDRVSDLDALADPAVAARRVAGIPLGRDGTAREFGRVAAFLLSSASSYVTGAMVPVDGGALRSF